MFIDKETLPEVIEIFVETYGWLDVTRGSLKLAESGVLGPDTYTWRDAWGDTNGAIVAYAIQGYRTSRKAEDAKDASSDSD
ncbi:hypothetical protein ABZ470_31925 [Streptosporangium sp. NPDC020072]|uniref:hypothetical protein n=1 Tax=Streptosporangium sp. NPDC020072 TaxID=3154788 RepID=UPI003444D04A